MEVIIIDILKGITLEPGYYVDKVEYEESSNTYFITIKSSLKQFACPICDQGATLYDHLPRDWRHLDFQQSKVYIHFDVPRARCSSHGIKQTKVNWARPRQNFTISLENLVCEQAKNKSFLEIAKQLEEHDTKIRRIVIKGAQNEENN